MSGWSEFDQAAMRRALLLAERGANSTHPNPRVGCVIARDEQIIGEGFHERAGEPHAEVFALRAVGERSRGATAYVTLEPCSHHGRTPPCADALIAAGLARVVYAIGDPDARVDGRGAARLHAAGMRVESGLLAGEAQELNAGFFTRLRHGRPWVRVKLAASIDGRTALANGESQWITGEAARADVQYWRARSAAVLTGIGTVLADDPALTVRLGAPPLPQPLRIILDSGFRLPLTARLLREPGAVQVMGVHSAACSALRQALAKLPSSTAEQGLRNAQCVDADASGRVDLAALLAQLGREQINELHVEAGAVLAGAFIGAGLVDELLLYLAPTLLGPQARPLLALPALAALADRPRFALHEVQRVGEDLRLRLRPPPSELPKA